jgi:hypothetical protein
MQIPKSLRISRKKYRIDVVNTAPKRGTMGETDIRQRTILVALRSTISNRVFRQEEVSNTFWHELTHAILADMDHALWDDERFVTAFADRLTEAINTARFD